MHKLQELKVWHKAINLAMKVYKVVENFPKEEKFGLIAQIKRCAISIPSNIAEGAGRNTQKDFTHFLAIANGSSYELQTQIIIAQKLNMIMTPIAENLLSELADLQKMNYRLQQSLAPKSI